jgi:hypothetical protein
MAKKTLKLSNLQRGEFMSFFATTQAAFSITLKLYDDQTTYFEATRSSTDINPPLADGNAFYVGNDLSLEITINSSNEIRQFINTFSLLTPKGDEIGHSYTVCGEDSIDEDFNDFYVNVMGWKAKG